MQEGDRMKDHRVVVIQASGNIDEGQGDLPGLRGCAGT
jgi:hypothetical protein